MGSRGTFLKSGGFSGPARWKAVNIVEGVKVLEPVNPRASYGLPERSNTPETKYMLYNKKTGTFKQLIKFDKDRMPVYEIDYGIHRGKNSLHIHFYKNGERLEGAQMLHPGDELYENNKQFFKGVEL